MNKIAVIVTYLCLALAHEEEHEALALLAANKCDPQITAAIKELWGDNVPTNMISKSQAAGKEFMTATTTGYYPKDMDCVYSFFNDKSVTLTYVFKDGFRTYEKILIEEDNGVIIDTETGIKRYEVYSKGGVSAHYKCHDQGKDGSPEGVIKIRDSDFEIPSIFEAVHSMNKVGITVNTVLSSDCPTINNTDDSF